MSLTPRMRVDIDPEGDTLLILAINQKIPASTDSSEKVAVKTEKHFLCSKKHLTFASHRAARVFSSNFKESSKQDDGLYHWDFGSAFNLEAFQIVLNVIHGKSRAVPRSLGTDVLAEIASVVDDLECSDAILIFGYMWLMPFGIFYHLPKTMDKTLAQLILISFVFESTNLFCNSTEAAIRHSSNIVPSFDLPIRTDIINRIKDSRARILQDLVHRLDRLQDDLLEGRLGCSQGCRAMLLGALLQAMKASKLYPPPEPPFSSLTLDSVIETLRNVQSPRYFSAFGDCPAGKRSGLWHMQEQPTALPPPPVKSTLFGPSSNQSHPEHNPVPKPASGWSFGASPALQSPPATNTAPGGLFGGRPEPRNGGFTPGGLFGTPAVPQANTATAPRTTSGGLFGGGTTPQTTSTPRPGGLFGNSSLFGSDATATEKASQSQTSEDKDAPQKITRHDCCLKDIIDPLILAVEEKIKGLQLADFPQL
ncbi:unnamed protein product [Fusarium venenatum]|uniref:BTB domain-containing protein n=1 Tax=Fusarium venenatum TaxID=56646 RepID=A0A2L2TDE9_9HYPO|nr:uncharacterized protein FVRRES_08195 [Fusarium venenatum]KAH6964985.1 hypothetical protein EDB82DRAFT_511346 [Fusarium venenatum]CEI68118.1 unnamed protein product [Fusarium venenatum]